MSYNLYEEYIIMELIDNKLCPPIVYMGDTRILNKFTSIDNAKSMLLTICQDNPIYAHTLYTIVPLVIVTL